MDDSELSNLPPEAHSIVEGPFDPDDNWLRTADDEEKLIAMREWWLARYCDPAMDTPYNGREGGYLYIHGGPFDPADELPERFSNLVEYELIEQVVGEMHSEFGDEWAPIRDDYHDYYDEDFGVEVDQSGEPLRRLDQRLAQSKNVLILEGDAAAKDLARKLVFGSVITALESYLWETMAYWVDTDDETVANILTKLPFFRDQPMKLGDIYDKQTSVKNDIKAYLQNLVWHRWEQVAPLLKHGLGVQHPSFKSFDEALSKRHDIVHRSGHTKQGLAIVVTIEEINALCETALSFGRELDARIGSRGEF